MDTKSWMLIRLISEIPSCPMMANVVSVSSAAPYATIPCSQSNPCWTGTYDFASRPPYMIPRSSTPAGSSRAASQFESALSATA